MITKQDIEDQRQLIQDDIMALLDGLDDPIITNVCQVVVDRMDILLGQMDGGSSDDSHLYRKLQDIVEARDSAALSDDPAYYGIDAAIDDARKLISRANAKKKE